MIARACSSTGCSGFIDDGYCNVCGSAPATSPVSELPMQPVGSGRTDTVPGVQRSRPVGPERPRRSRIGLGLTTIPPAEAVDPTLLILNDIEVPESMRFCARCGAEVGRGFGDAPGRAEGYCSRCRARYSFTARLHAGDVVAEQYEVVGPLAHGGVGWVYLARDRHVGDRFVVLKGVVNTGDGVSDDAVAAERDFLAHVHHESIVDIFNFVERDGVDYIVMEYADGPSLKDILKARMADNGGRYDPLPLDWALAFIIDVLPALGYLHEHGLLYCDFKPDNIIHVDDAVKLIDLGGAMRADDRHGDVYGTVGYQAPEIALDGPSPSSDLYSVGRTLAVLTFPFTDFRDENVHTIPQPEEVPLFREHDSFHRVLTKLTRRERDDRFQSADEVRDQLVGVLREVVTKTRGVPPAPTTSTLFGPFEPAAIDIDWPDLPRLKLDPADPMSSWIVRLPAMAPKRLLRRLTQAPRKTAQVHLVAAAAALRIEDVKLADNLMDVVLERDPWQWRAFWVKGLSALVRRDRKAALSCFNACYAEVPGELAPKFALALACEAGRRLDAAHELYQVCARVDVAYTAPSAFGLARVQAARGDVAGAISALERVPETDRFFVDARNEIAAVRSGRLRFSQLQSPRLFAGKAFRP